MSQAGCETWVSKFGTACIPHSDWRTCFAAVVPYGRYYSDIGQCVDKGTVGRVASLGDADT
jgi:hypothetical protein